MHKNLRPNYTVINMNERKNDFTTAENVDF